MSTPNRWRRGIAWAVLGLAGIGTGSAYSSGIVGTETTVDGSGTATPILGVSAQEPQSPSPYLAAVATFSPLAITLADPWGAIDVDHAVFDVDLSEFPGETFFVDVLVDDPATGWTTAQLKWLQLPCPAGAGALTPAEFDSAYAVAASDAPGDPKLLDATVGGSRVTFAELAGGARWCFGIRAATPQADDATGTILASGGGTPTTPTFTAVANRSA